MRVTDDVLVADGATLTIAPGVRVEFQGFHALRVAGRLLAVGTPEHPIVFTHAHPELFAFDTTRAGSWHGIRFDRTSALNDSSRLEHCRVTCAKGIGAEDRGGAIYASAVSKLRIANCIFAHNLAGYGAVLYCGLQAAPTVVGCVAYDNVAVVGGSVICAHYGYPRVTGCTLVGNAVQNEEIFYGTAAIETFIAKPWVRGSILSWNSSNYFLGGQIYEGKAWYVTYSDIQGGYAGEGDFDADPMFVDSGEHPFALEEGSPCIDAGPPDAGALDLPAVDPSGAPRVWHGRVDVGAYEWSDPAGIAWEWRTAAGASDNLSCWPAPALGGGWVRFRLERAARATLTAHDATGRLLATILDEPRPAGEHRVAWDAAARESHPGPVFLRLRLDGRDAGAARALLISR